MTFGSGRLTGWLVGGTLAVCALSLAASGWSEEGLRNVLRASARISVTFFSIAFSASSLCVLWPTEATRLLLRQRRQIGLSFAAAHFVHLAALAALARWFPEPLVSDVGAVTLVGGGIAYAFIAAMALTSNDRAQAKLGADRWRLLHRVGAYYVWALFAQSYLPRAAENPRYVPAAALVVAALLLRVGAGLRSRRARRLRVAGI